MFTLYTVSISSVILEKYIFTSKLSNAMLSQLGNPLTLMLPYTWVRRCRATKMAIII